MTRLVNVKEDVWGCRCGLGLGLGLRLVGVHWLVLRLAPSSHNRGPARTPTTIEPSPQRSRLESVANIVVLVAGDIHGTVTVRPLL